MTLHHQTFAGQVVVISGGAGGVGAAAAARMSEGGAAVAIVDQDEAAGRRITSDLRADGRRAAFIHGDVSLPETSARAVAEAVNTFGRIDVLVNHAGTIIVRPFLETSHDDWRRLVDVNVMSMVYMTRAALPTMIEQGRGSIVNMASISGFTAATLESAYSVTKGAVIQLTRAIAVEYRDRGIRCNAVCPGFIQTAHGERELIALGQQGVDVSPEAIEALQGRMATPDEIAEAVVFLASDAARFVNGSLLVVDNAATATT